jgi:glycosyltransferase involved in cell wall biosynthesis
MASQKKLKILIATGIYPPDVGGPAKYAKNLQEEFSRMGHKVRVVKYGIEKKLPTGIRHLWYFFRVFPALWGVDYVLALDTFSVGLPVSLSAKICRKKIAIRVGGDFLWESYVQRTGDRIALVGFYKKKPNLSFKEKVIFSFTKFALNGSVRVVFSTNWQKEIFASPYELDPAKCFIIENFYGEKETGLPASQARALRAGDEPVKKNFLYAGRLIKIKSLEALEKASEKVKKENSELELDIISGLGHDELMRKIRDCYAVVLPSLSEVSPNFILEAIRFNKPFILTRENGLYEKLKDIGVFVNPLDEGDIAQKILFLAEGQNYEAQKKKVENFNFTHSWQEIASEFLNVLKG